MLKIILRNYPNAGYKFYMFEDIRDKTHINHKDITGLNFIRQSVRYYFRKYHKQGLRSQIIEVLDPDDLNKQYKGESRNGLMFYPWARPLKMLRIFRTRFESLESAMEETRKLKIIEKYLPPGFYAKSIEFIVDYVHDNKRDFILCGLQDYVEGETLNPWEMVNIDQVVEILVKRGLTCGFSPATVRKDLVLKLKKNAETFIKSVKTMIMRVGVIPDFAGVENILCTCSGNIQLVDINNISTVSFGSEINLDEKKYPVCDKSIEALSLLEQKLLGRPIDRSEKIYKIFLNPGRMKKVQYLEEKFIKLKQEK